MKKKVGNRLIALVLALFMTVTMMPDMAVWAEETDNGVADEAQKCGYEQPKAINVGELDEDEAEDLPIVRAQYNAADASYWAVYGSDYYYSKMSGAEKQFYQALYDVNMSFLQEIRAPAIRPLILRDIIIRALFQSVVWIWILHWK